MNGRQRFSVRVEVLRASAAGAVVLGLVAGVACGVRTPLSEPTYEGTFVEGTDAGTIVTISRPDATIVDAQGTDEGEDAGVDGANADVALPPDNLGNVILTSGDYASGTIPTLAAQAVFFPSVTATGCSIAPVVAGCTLETCTSATTSAPVTSAGSIAVTGGAFPLLLAQSGVTYAPVAEAGALALWKGGEDLVVTASGATVPAFVGDVVAPTQVTVLTAMPTTISRGAPLTFSWFGASAGALTVNLSATSSAGADYYLECQFDVGVGSGVVPAEALTTMPAGIAGLTVSTMDRTNVTAGSWVISIFAQTNANDTNDAQYAGDVELE